MHETESLYCTVQIDTTLHSNYASINKNLKTSIKNVKLLFGKRTVKR